MSHQRDLTDVQWAVLDPLIPKPKCRKDGRGRPWRERREVLNGILFILRTGAPWADLPDRYPPYQTCHRRFQHWVRSGGAGCAVPWHWHPATENIMMVSGTAETQVKGERTIQLGPGSFLTVPPKHVMNFACAHECTLFVYTDEPFALHCVDEGGKRDFPDRSTAEEMSPGCLHLQSSFSFDNCGNIAIRADS